MGRSSLYFPRSDCKAQLKSFVGSRWDPLKSCIYSFYSMYNFHLSGHIFAHPCNLTSPYSISYFHHLLLLPPTYNTNPNKTPYLYQYIIYTSMKGRNVASWRIFLMFAKGKVKSKDKHLSPYKSAKPGGRAAAVSHKVSQVTLLTINNEPE